MAAAYGVGGMVLGLGLFATGLVAGVGWVIALGMVTIFGSGILGVNLGKSNY